MQVQCGDSTQCDLRATLSLTQGGERVGNYDGSIPVPERRLLSEKQAAAYLGIGTTTFRKRGIPDTRIRRRILYDRFDLDHWLDEYKGRGRAIKEDLWPEKEDSTGGKTHRTGGSTSSSRMDAEYAKALGVKP